jgi:hypothetical protein
MRQAMRGAHAWWNAMVTMRMKEGLDQLAAELVVRRRYPMGPCVDRGVIGVLRAYWLACEETNRRSTAAGSGECHMWPEDFVLGAWVKSPFSDVAEFLSQLPYWPMGMDAEGQWI